MCRRACAVCSASGERLFPFFVNGRSLEVGPIPKGTPVGLITNLDVLDLDDPPELRARSHEEARGAARRVKKELKQRHNIFASPDVLDGMLSLSKCPDFVVNKGHYFGTALGDETPVERCRQACADRAC